MNYLLNDNRNILYADDTAIIYIYDDLNALVVHVNNKLAQKLDSCHFNKMILNPTKSQYILLTNKLITNDPVINLGDEN